MRKRPRDRSPAKPVEASATRLGLRRVTKVDQASKAEQASKNSAWELVPPRCALDRADDLDEVREMIAAGESEVAIDELRWLLDECADCLEAHRLLGELALEAGDVPLARAHFGNVYRIVSGALPAGFRGTLSADRPANAAFYESAARLVACLRELGKQEMLAEVLARLRQIDPSDAAGIQRGAEPPCQRPDEPEVYDLRP